MEFGEGDDEDDGEIGSGSGSAGEEEGDWKKLALGTGSGGVKGRRKGMVFKCETCSKVSRLFDRANLRNIVTHRAS